MKHLLAYLLLMTFLLLVAAGIDARAQQQQPPATAEGFWVLESNVKTPETTIAYFYNNDQVLVYKEKIEGVRLNVNKRKTVKQLNAVLQQALTAWKNEKAVRENKGLLASRLH